MDRVSVERRAGHTAAPSQALNRALSRALYYALSRAEPRPEPRPEPPPERLNRTAKALNEQHRTLVQTFYSPMVFEDVMDVFLEVFEAAQAPEPDLMLELFCDPTRAD